MSDTAHEAPERILMYVGNIEYVRADRIEELEAKLTKAMEALELIADIEPDDIGRFHDIANTTLEKLKG